ncbi:unnamed protein product [Notodromas monacha]|uniref:Uncharacterized protein n=1 Tax=Notodromas monacha TaxID=399045 RepID=A0A7R9GER7_9CRUS|nr:unnamed protein product [Notodromas monacha]CAG0920020.1 unnamed protein product [Notodromas monacha]
MNPYGSVDGHRTLGNPGVGQAPPTITHSFQPLQPVGSPTRLPDVVQPPMPPTPSFRPPQPQVVQQGPPVGLYPGTQGPQPSYPSPVSGPPFPGYGQNAPQAMAPQQYPPQQQPLYGSYPTDAPVQASTINPMQPQQPRQGYWGDVNQLSQGMAGMSVNQGFNAGWGVAPIDLLQNRHIIPPNPVIEPPKITLQNEYWSSVNCESDIFRCTMTKIPETSGLLQKCRLPLGILIHPFKDLPRLPVVQCNTIVRCRACRTYINPFVHFIDKRRWKCNLCFRSNDVPDEFLFDPKSSTYGDPGRRPELQSATIEFIAPSEYMLRPPQPAAYVFLLDVSWNAVQSGYLKIVCDTLLAHLPDRLPGDSRTLVSFIAFNSALHFFALSPECSRPKLMTVKDVDDVFLPTPDTLLVNLAEIGSCVEDLLTQLPMMFNEPDAGNALGAALQAAHKLLGPIGGRVTVFQTQLPDVGPGALKSREDPNQRAGKDVHNLNPATDFYKKLALDCSAQQICVDLWLLSGQYADLATLSGISKFSGGCIHYIPGFHVTRFPLSGEKLEAELGRYLSRKIGFEAVMRVRCTRGLAVHTFHGNFFVRSTDLLSLPNVNPDAGFGMQVVIEEALTGVQNACFQAAVLYTSSKGERRIRVHTLCLPVSGSLPQLLHSVDQEAVVGLLAKMAVDRTVTASLTDAREAFVNMVVDMLSAFRAAEGGGGMGLTSAPNARLIPVYVLALMKSVAFRVGTSTKLDDRVFSMCQMKASFTSLPLADLILMVYPCLYPVHNMSDEDAIVESDGEIIPQPPRLPLTYERIDSGGVYLMDSGDKLTFYVCRAINPAWILAVFNVHHFSHIQDGAIDLPELDTRESKRVRSFLGHLQAQKFMPATLVVMREDSKDRMDFVHRLVEDKSDCGSSYYEFLQMLKGLVK